MSTPAEKGFATPTGTDLISLGDNAITKNAIAAVALYDELNGKLWRKGRAPTGTNWDNHRTPGVLIVHSLAAAESMIGLPENFPGAMETVADPDGSTIVAVQRYTTYKHNREWRRASETSSTWTEWELVGIVDPGGGTVESLDAGLANSLRMDDFMQRWGGSKKYPGKAVIAFRYDHGLKNFNEICRPVHEAKNMPYTLALGSRHWDHAENAGVTAAMVNTWATGSLCTVANHSALSAAGHVDGTTYEELHDLIVTGLQELKAQIPKAMIDMFIIPGVGGTGLNGLGGGGTPEAFYETVAGQLILANHALTSGGFPNSMLKALDGNPRQGMTHQGYDTTPVATVKAKIDEAVAGKRGLNLFLHPSRLNMDGYATTADFMEIITYVDSLRAAGKLEVLSMYELQLADSRP